MSGRLWTAAVRAGTALAIGATAHTVWNLSVLRRPITDPPPVREGVSVLLPVRNEESRVADCLAALLAPALENCHMPEGIQVIVDIDPVDLM